MLTRIVHNSEKLCTFVEQLGLDLSQPQRRHLLNIADALLVCEDEKTLAALQRQFVEARDASNMADFLRISPWEAGAVRAALRQHQVAWVLAAAERSGAPKVLYINIDDSLGEKDKATKHLEPVAWFHDHSESTKNRPRYKNAFCYVVCTLRCGDYVATLDLQLYLRAQTVRKLNRERPRAQRLAFRSKYRIARQMLVALAPLTPPRLASVRAIRQLVRFRPPTQVCPPPRVARHLRAQKQSHAQWYATQDPCPGPQAQVVYRSPSHHCGRGQRNLLCALAGRPVSRGPLYVPRFLFQTASQSLCSGVHRMYGFGLLRQTGVARIHLALVLRNRQLLPQKPNRLERFPRAVFRGGGQIYRRRTFGLGVCRTAFCQRTLASRQNLRRHPPTASGRTCYRLVTRGHSDGRRNQRCRGRATTLLAPRNHTDVVVSPMLSLGAVLGFEKTPPNPE